MNNKRWNYALWAVQVLLALLFLFTGGMKLALSVAALAKLSPLPGLFLKFIGVAEVAGALGLILPGMLGTRQGLTPLAAAGLVVIMAGATTVTLATGGGGAAVLPALVGCLAALVARARMASAAMEVVHA